MLEHPQRKVTHLHYRWPIYVDGKLPESEEQQRRFCSSLRGYSFHQLRPILQNDLLPMHTDDEIVYISVETPWEMLSCKGVQLERPSMTPYQLHMDWCDMMDQLEKTVRFSMQFDVSIDIAYQKVFALEFRELELLAPVQDERACRRSSTKPQPVYRTLLCELPSKCVEVVMHHVARSLWNVAVVLKPRCERFTCYDVTNVKPSDKPFASGRVRGDMRATRRTFYNRLTSLTS